MQKVYYLSKKGLAEANPASGIRAVLRHESKGLRRDRLIKACGSVLVVDDMIENGLLVEYVSPAQKKADAEAKAAQKKAAVKKKADAAKAAQKKADAAAKKTAAAKKKKAAAKKK